MALVLAGGHHRHAVRVLYGLGDPRLPGKAPAERLVTRKVALDELQRDPGPIGPGGGVDLAHPALAKEVVDVVFADLGSDPWVGHGSLLLHGVESLPRCCG